MKYALLLFFLSGGLLTVVHAQELKAAVTACPSTTTLDELVVALDAAVSGPANKDRACLRDVLLPEARLSPIVKAQDGTYAPHLLTVDDWINAVAKRGDTPLYEVQVKAERLTFAHMAHLWCHYEIRSTPDGPATVTGINSIQAVFDGTRWRVLTVLWEPGAPAPPVEKK